jgi:nucleoside-diphosphate-sugar epimerase
MTEPRFIIAPDDPILVTGAAGFIGLRVVEALLDCGFRNLRCLVRPAKDAGTLDAAVRRRPAARVDIIRGNLLSHEECSVAAKDVALVLHLAAARGEKSFPDAFMNSVVTTRNLLDACLRSARLVRVVSVSSFSVYANSWRRGHRILDEDGAIEPHPELRGDAYCYAKVKQDALVAEYGARFDLPYVIVRPGYVYGPGNEGITGRVGIGTFGMFLHLGGSNSVPFTFVDNCADAIVLAGLVKGIEGQTFNIVDDDLPSSRGFLRQYKRQVRRFPSLYLPHAVSYALCRLWEHYAGWSEGQLPPTFNRRMWYAYWKKTRYTNGKAKAQLGWKPRVPTSEGMRRYFESCRARYAHA